MADTINILKPSGCFEIQKIIGISTIHGSCKSYQVQWAPTWISGAHLIGCEDLIEQFEQVRNSTPIAEISSNQSKGDSGLSDTTDDPALNLQIKQEIQDDLPGIVTNAFPPDYTDHENDTGLEFNSLHNSVIDERSLHTDQVDQVKTDSININGLQEDNEGLLVSDSPKTIVIIQREGNSHHDESFQHFIAGSRKKQILSNMSGGNIDVNLLSDVSDLSRPQLNVWSKTLSQCDLCNKVFSNNAALEDHIKTHDCFHQCDICFKVFGVKRNLQKHELLHIETCSICKEKFNDIEKLQEHLEMHKTVKEDPLECSFCEKRFRHKVHLDEHERVHTKERPFECKICSRRFSRNRVLIRHHKKKHQIVNPKAVAMCEQEI